MVEHAETSPVLLRRQVGARLRRLREAADKSLQDVGDHLECSAAKISRVENGRLLARIPDVRSMLDLYGVTGPDREELLDLVRNSRKPGWWRAYSDILGENTETFLGLEDSAAYLWDHEAYLIPGLLQTRDYAYAVSAPRTDVTERQTDRYVKLRMTRQAILHRTDPPQLHVILDESALHRLATLGSSTARGQLDHLVETAELPHVTLQILTYAAGIAASGGMPFVIFGFPDPADPKVVYLEQLHGARIENRFDQVARYDLAFNSLRSAALSPTDSTTFITNLRHQLP